MMALLITKTHMLLLSGGHVALEGNRNAFLGPGGRTFPFSIRYLSFPRETFLQLQLISTFAPCLICSLSLSLSRD